MKLLRSVLSGRTEHTFVQSCKFLGILSSSSERDWIASSNVIPYSRRTEFRLCFNALSSSISNFPFLGFFSFYFHFLIPVGIFSSLLSILKLTDFFSLFLFFTLSTALKIDFIFSSSLSFSPYYDSDPDSSSSIDELLSSLLTSMTYSLSYSLIPGDKSSEISSNSCCPFARSSSSWFLDYFLFPFYSSFLVAFSFSFIILFMFSNSFFCKSDSIDCCLDII